MLYITTFTVTGRFNFPIDMLRYDGCYPARGEDAGAIMDTFRPGTSGRPKGAPIQVNLEKLHRNKDPDLEPGRWASFQWSVDSDSILTRRL